MSPIEQEMVIASMRAGMPIIPFPMPSLVIANNNLEETKTIIRENSVKDIKFHQQTDSEVTIVDWETVNLSSVYEHFY